MIRSRYVGNSIALLGLLFAAGAVQAAPLDDIVLQQYGDEVHATIRLTTPVHFSRAVSAKKSRLLEIYYERIPSSDATEPWTDLEVRRSPATTLTPAFVVTTRDQAMQPKLVIEFASEVESSVSPSADGRSFVVTLKTEKTDEPAVVAVSAPLPWLPTVLPPVVGAAAASAVAAASVGEAVPAEDYSQQAYPLMQAGRDALSANNYNAAIEAFNKLLMLPPNQYSQDAQEWVGVARERGGQTAKAKVEYELYLKLYSKGQGVQWVKQRLANLATPLPTQKMSAPAKKIEPRSFVQGGISSRYYFGQTNLDTTYPFNNSVQTTNYSLKDQSSLITSVDATGRYVNETYDNRLVFRDVLNQTFLTGKTDRNRLNAAYMEIKNRTADYSARMGRQTTGGGGVMGRFDGVWAGYGSVQDLRVNGVAGQLVDFTSSIQPIFYGVSVDKGPISVYLLNQTIEGVLDRRAVGSELKYFDTGKSAFAMVDYDIYFNVLNATMVTGSYALEATGTTFNFIGDYRKSPSMSTRNALNGASTTSVKDLQLIMTDTQLMQLARDRTASSAFSQLGVTQKLNQTWQVAADLKLSKTSGMPASGLTVVEGVLPAYPGTGWEKTITSQLIASNLYSASDVTSLGASLIASDYVQNGQSLFLYNRTSWDRELSFDSSWNFYRQSDSYGGSMVRNMPMVRVTYQVQQKLSLDADVGLELTSSSGPYQSSTNTRTSASMGFRWDF